MTANSLSPAIQEELEVLKSIYGDDYCEATGTWSSASFTVKCVPLTKSLGKDDQITAVLKFSLPKTYPKLPPTVEIIKSVGLSAKHIEFIKLKFRETMNSMAGSIMCYELTSACIDYLESIQKPQTFFDLMVKRQESELIQLQQIRKQAQFNEISSNTIVTTPVKSSIISHETRDHSTNKPNIFGKLSLEDDVDRLSDPTPDRHRNLSRYDESESDSDEKYNSDSDIDNEDGVSRFQTSTTMKREALDEKLFTHPPAASILRAHEQQHLSQSRLTWPPGYGGNDFQATSRYYQEFDEIALLGAGAGGEVWSCKNKLDRRVYAIKKISWNPSHSVNEERNSRLRREVATISRLIHKNVVRYYAAWLEDDFSNELNRSENSSPDTPFDVNITEDAKQDQPKIMNIVKDNVEWDELWKSDNTSELLLFDQSDIFARSRSTSSSSASDCETDSKSSSKNSSEKVSRDNSECDDYSNSNRSENGNSESVDESGVIGKSSITNQSLVLTPSLSVRKRKLYIQMEYCHSTLRTLIDEGKLYRNHALCVNLFRQILEGLAYIHRKRMLHRDLKPANIFLDGSGQIKIGDFGLATYNRGTAEHLEALAEDDEENEDMVERLLSPNNRVGTDGADGPTVTDVQSSRSLAEAQEFTRGVGTASYRAPEVDSGWSIGSTASNTGYARVSDKSDMYSLGIILFEMCYPPFGTGMERIITLRRLRDSIEFPVDFNKYDTGRTMQEVISKLLVHDTSKRPSARELLLSPLIPAKTDTDLKYLAEITSAITNSSMSSDKASAILETIFKQRYEANNAAGTLNNDLVFDVKSLSRAYHSLQSHVVQFSPTTQQMEEKATSLCKLTLNKKFYTAVYNLQQVKFSILRLIENVFCCHGASYFSPALFMPISGLTASTINHHTKYLDLHGNAFTMPTNLITPFARHIALLQIETVCRYDIGKVAQHNGKTHNDGQLDGDVNHATEAVFDVVMSNQISTPFGIGVRNNHEQAELALSADVELLSTTAEICTSTLDCIKMLSPACLRFTFIGIYESLCILVCIGYEWEVGKKKKENHLKSNGHEHTFSRRDTLNENVWALFKQLGDICGDKLRVNDLINKFLADLRFPDECFRTRIAPFIEILYNQPFLGSGPDIICHTLHALEEEFYKCDLIIAMSRQLLSEKQKPPPVMISKSGAVSSPSNNRHLAKTVAADSRSPTAATAPNSTVTISKSSTLYNSKGYLDASSIGKTSSASAQASSDLADRGKATPDIAYSEIPPKNFRERQGSIGIDIVLSPVEISRLRSAVRHFDNSIGQASSVFQSLARIAEAFPSGSSYHGLNFRLDIGLSPQSTTSPFVLSDGFYFCVDLVSSSVEQSTEIPPNTFLHSKRSVTVIEGGHFESVVKSWNPHYRSNHGVGNCEFAACGIRIKVDTLVGLVAKEINSKHFRSKQEAPKHPNAGISSPIIYSKISKLISTSDVIVLESCSIDSIEPKFDDVDARKYYSFGIASDITMSHLRNKLNLIVVNTFQPTVSSSHSDHSLRPNLKRNPSIDSIQYSSTKLLPMTYSESDIVAICKFYGISTLVLLDTLSYRPATRPIHGSEILSSTLVRVFFTGLNGTTRLISEQNLNLTLFLQQSRIFTNQTEDVSEFINPRRVNAVSFNNSKVFDQSNDNFKTASVLNQSTRQGSSTTFQHSQEIICVFIDTKVALSEASWKSSALSTREKRIITGPQGGYHKEKSLDKIVTNCKRRILSYFQQLMNTRGQQFASVKIQHTGTQALLSHQQPQSISRASTSTSTASAKAKQQDHSIASILNRHSYIYVDNIVFAIDVPFVLLRELGNSVLSIPNIQVGPSSGNPSSLSLPSSGVVNPSGASTAGSYNSKRHAGNEGIPTDVTSDIFTSPTLKRFMSSLDSYRDQFPNLRRDFRVLLSEMSIQNLMQGAGKGSGMVQSPSTGPASLAKIHLYSTIDDRFDILAYCPVTLGKYLHNDKLV